MKASILLVEDEPAIQRPGAAAPLSVRLHELERQSLRALGQRTQGGPSKGLHGVQATHHSCQRPCGVRDRSADRGPELDFAPIRSRDGQEAAFALFELERQASFFMTGGLIAAHASGRDRNSFWQAMDRHEVYGTSGPRILLWFDLINPPGTRGRPLPMGRATEMGLAPIFQVRAVGSPEQKPGCPDYAVNDLGPEGIEHVCKSECYNPMDRRRIIDRIEVVRIQPQQSQDEPLGPLIQDPWRTIECDPDPEGCSVTFTDPEYARIGRDTLYYVRVFETPAPAINADGVRCTYDSEGRCSEVNLCQDSADQCLGEHEPSAWSSPIFVDWAG